MAQEKDNQNENWTEEDLLEIFEGLRILERDFLDEAKLFLGSDFYPMDMFASAIINRSISLMRGFVTLAKENNYISAVPIIRLQLDNSLRFFATTLVKDRNEFVFKYLSGTHISKIKDLKGKELRDGYLTSELDKVIPGVKKLYGNVSGHIHLSNYHYFLQTQVVAGEEGVIKTRIGNYDFFSIGKKVDFAFNMLKASEILLEIVKSWSFHKLKGGSETGK